MQTTSLLYFCEILCSLFWFLYHRPIDTYISNFHLHTRMIYASIYIPQCYTSLTHIHKDGHCFHLLLSIFHPCFSPVSGSHRLYVVDLLRMLHASGTWFKCVSTSCKKNPKYLDNSELHLHTNCFPQINLNYSTCQASVHIRWFRYFTEDFYSFLMK